MRLFEECIGPFSTFRAKLRGQKNSLLCENYVGRKNEYCMGGDIQMGGNPGNRGGNFKMKPMGKSFGWAEFV